MLGRTYDLHVSQDHATLTKFNSVGFCLLALQIRRLKLNLKKKNQIAGNPAKLAGVRGRDFFPGRSRAIGCPEPNGHP